MTAYLEPLRDLCYAAGMHLWQTTLFLIPLLLLARFLRSAPARVLQLVWTLALLKILVPLAALALLLRELLPSMLVAASSKYGAYGAVPSARLAIDPLPFLGLGSEGSTGGSMLVPAVLMLVWLGLAVHRLAGWGHALHPGGRQVGRPLDGVAPRVRERIERALAGTPIPTGCLQVLNRPGVPHVAGLLRPRILVPVVLATQLETEELRAILLHEDGHRRRFDPLRVALHRLGSAVFCAYPLWDWLGRKLQETGELLCDERVVRSGITRAAYARALAKALRLGLFSSVQPAALSGRRASTVRQRFERIEEPWRFAMKPGHRVALLSTLCLLIAGGLGLCLHMACSPQGPEQASAPASTPPASLAATEPGASASPGAHEASAAPDSVLQGAEQEMPVPIHMPEPTYPPQLAGHEVGGVVTLRMLITKAGTVSDVRATQEIAGHPEFTQAAVTAARQWLFRPASLNGQPVACWLQVPLSFASD